MTSSKQELWRRFAASYWEDEQTGLGLDLSRVNWPAGFYEQTEPKVSAAFEAMAKLEQGAIANPDENRMVGHYWLRAPELAPTVEIREAITSTVERISTFAEDIRSGSIKGNAGKFTNVIIIGIGGSALGPQFVSHALAPATAEIRLWVLDNTDPDGLDRTLQSLKGQLGSTLTIVISKSGGTKETRNGMLETRRAYETESIAFARHAVAVTQANSDLDKAALADGWLDRFPMWDWVGGRTSELSAVGLLPAAIQGIDIVNMLNGARKSDELTRNNAAKANPAMQMALAWYAAGNGRGDRNLVILPYKDRLELFAKYLQQLIMESIGKERDLEGRIVNQGLTVLGNKGSTDQHSFVQQLREGRNDFIATFIEVLQDRTGPSMEVEPGLTSGDYLQGFYLGTRYALSENDRPSITLTIPAVNAHAVGMLIALFERTVGFYASLLGINAYHQPGVEAGKKAAAGVVGLKAMVLSALATHRGRALPVETIASHAKTDDFESVFKICKRLAHNNMCNILGQDVHLPDKAKFTLS